MAYRVRSQYLHTAIGGLRGSKAADHFARVYLVLKKLGMNTKQPVIFTTADEDADAALKYLLEIKGLPTATLQRQGASPQQGQALYDPFTNVALKEDYLRSGVQTLVNKWLQGNEKKSAIAATWLTITKLKEGAKRPLQVQMRPTYVEYLGRGEVGLAQNDASQIRIPIKAFIAWYFRYTVFETAPRYTDLRLRLIQEMHFEEAEVMLLFDEEDTDITEVFEAGEPSESDILNVVVREYGAGSKAEQAARPLTEDARRRVRDIYVTPQMLSDPFFRELTDEDIKGVLEQHLNVLLVGPPGTGKTFRATEIGRHLAGDDSRIEHVQLHEGYAYEDFVEAIVPKPVDNAVKFEPVPRIFRSIVERALGDPHQRFVIVLDEINRASIAKVFGEAFSLIDTNWRLHFDGREWKGRRVRLPYSDKEFGVPDNLYLIATMNDIDRSTFELDYAFMRRFYMIRIEPSPSQLRAKLVTNGAGHEVIEATLILLSRLQEIFPVGHVYFERVKTFDDLRQTYASSVRPAIKSFVGERGRDKLQQADALVLGLLAPPEPD